MSNIETIQKPKRVYKKRVIKPVSEPVSESVIEAVSEQPVIEQPVIEQPVIEQPVIEPVIEVSPKEKKPRTEKQVAAFNRMREARIKKQAELQHLKDVHKQQILIDKEQIKLEKVEEQIIKKKASRAPRAKKVIIEEPLYEESEPQRIQVSSLKPIMFM